MSVFNLPDLGEGLTEAEIVQWQVAPGDDVELDSPLVSVETDKAVVDIPAPQSGRVVKLFAGVGDVVEVGSPLVEFSTGVEEADEEDTGAVVGKVVAGDSVIEEKPMDVTGGKAGSVKATPSVRALAARMEVDLALVSPSGPGGAITAKDVRRVAERLQEMGPIEVLKGPRKAMARRMIQSGAEVVPATIVDDADVDCWDQEMDVSTRLLLAIVAGCRQEPALNAWFDSHSMGRRVLPEIDIAVAVDTESGLFTPVVRDAGNRDYASLLSGLRQLKTDVGERKVPVEEMRGYTITLSNFGTLAGRYASPVVVPPTVAILGAGRIEPRAVIVDDEVVKRCLLPLSLTFDHRAVTGGEAARFLAAVISSLESRNGK